MTSDLQRFQQELTAHLDWFAERGRKVRFWWRDDDAVAPTPALDRMQELANRYDVDLALAVIPKDATEALAERLSAEPHAFVLQHGWQHKNFQRKDLGEKAAELGTRRDPDALMAELNDGKARLEALFGEKFLPVMVPPWNRIAPEICRRLPGIGLPGLSTFTWFNFPRDIQVQSHVDILKWKKQVRFIGWESARLRFDLQLTRRRNTGDEPLGLLTHHLVHDAGCFEFLEVFLEIAAHHDGADWPGVKDLFGRPGDQTSEPAAA
ncbi:polysaccharide deacetylase family protein [Roseibium sediminicola]|uniref:Polysaccharide deacetylase family protein n=1 Tax=Roseibium sediminicola TaxID=2933272 RepID=A0ABT0GQG4_9HYPH|nr:polysaccharide deacetylase family protein [Roseibium sp. CAU 1639]MCK7611676.1 polysaccharide deacetylase family protein [Roseibium sp. CAU 1639]